jgi:hypothetical protein
VQKGGIIPYLWTEVTGGPGGSNSRRLRLPGARLSWGKKRGDLGDFREELTVGRAWRGGRNPAGGELGGRLGSQVRRRPGAGSGGAGVGAQLGHAQGSNPPLYRGTEHQSPRRARTPRLAAAAPTVKAVASPGRWALAGQAEPERAGSGLRARPVPA